MRRIKNILPEHNENERRESVEKTDIPDKVTLGYTDKDIFKILEDLKPDIIALGYDQRVSEDKLNERLPGCKDSSLKTIQTR